MTNFTFGRMADRAKTTERDFKIAGAIVAGGRKAALDYALGWHEHHKPERWVKGTETQRKVLRDNLADGVMECATRIVADGRAHYENHGTLIVCTLMADGRAGPFGYDAWN